MMGGYGWVLGMPSKTIYWLELKRTLKLDRPYAFLRTQDVGMDLSIELDAESLQFPIIGFLQKAFYSHLFSAHSRSGRMSDYQNLVSATWSLSVSRPEIYVQNLDEMSRFHMPWRITQTFYILESSENVNKFWLLPFELEQIYFAWSCKRRSYHKYSKLPSVHPWKK